MYAAECSPKSLTFHRLSTLQFKINFFQNKPQLQYSRWVRDRDNICSWSKNKLAQSSNNVMSVLRASYSSHGTCT